LLLLHEWGSIEVKEKLLNHNGLRHTRGAGEIEPNTARLPSDICQAAPGVCPKDPRDNIGLLKREI
jgi:hypothetical protein